ncbi:class I fructose-bisphosphate aldolase [Propionibacteriaceae bacterium G1746]
MSGTQIRLQQLFNAESGRSFITAFDHGQSLPMPATSGHPITLLEKIIAGGPEGVLVNPGILRQSAHLFARRGAPVPVLRADWCFLDEKDKNELGERYRVLTSPAEALALGAGAICMYLIYRPTDGGMFADNVNAVAKAAQEARRVGIPLIVEGTLWGLRNEDRKDPESLATVNRIAAEMGADAIKTEYTDADTMPRIIETVGDIPVLTLGGAKGDEQAVRDAASGAIKAGAKGLIFGRNVWNTDDVVATTKALTAITHAPLEA